MAKKNGPDFESSIQRLQDIVRELEGPDLPLEKNVALYKEGCLLAKSCREMLEKARHEISLCAEDGSLQAFAPERRPEDEA
ncbi:exodeoxyribonuclease VII small subunit [Desulfovibrio sp. OttesenSCG-928-G11]|nr:exodeoxyribonuclease VII small subunit [Desulfovibrio sp. OttesenSCG-928-G11]